VKGFAGWLVEAEAASLQARPAPEMYDGCSVLYRGYIANVSALIEESKERGEALKDTSDGQLFVKAYHWWGEKLQSRVLGEYAVAVFNKQRSSLFLTHDSLGLVPLFYSERPDGLAFASHLHDLVLLTGIQDLDEEYIADYLATCSVISARTPYAHIRRLLRGQSLHWILSDGYTNPKSYKDAESEPVARPDSSDRPNLSKA